MGQTPSSFYNQRMSENLRREILWVIQNEMNNPTISALTITVISINLAKDNRNATVMVSVLGDEIEQKNAIKALNFAAGFIQSTVAKRVKMKYFPKLLFKIDKSFEHSSRIDEILLKVKDDLELE